MFAFGLLTVCLPATSQDQAEKKPSHSSVNVVKGTYINNSSQGNTVLTRTDETGRRSQLVATGKITIAPDEKSIIAISDGGKFEYSVREKNAPEHMVVLKHKNGELVGFYWVDHEPKDYNTAGKAWLAQQLPEVISTTGIGAEARAERLMQEGGSAKVLDYTATMPSGSGKTKMYRYLLANPDLKPTDLQTLVEQVGQTKNSDYEVVSLLTKIPASKLNHSGIAEAYVKAAAGVGSDYEKAKALKHLLLQENLPESTLTRIAEASAGMSSDYEKRKLLTSLAARPELTEKQFAFAMKALQKVSSDYERTQALSPFMKHEKQVIRHFDQVLPLISTIGSDYEKVKAYGNLLKVGTLGSSQYVPLLKASEGISSDYEKSKLLRKIATQLPKDDKRVRDAFAHAAKTVSSKYEYDKVMASFK